MFCHRTSLKKTSGHMGTRTCIAGLSQQTYYALDHHAWGPPRLRFESPRGQKMGFFNDVP